MTPLYSMMEYLLYSYASILDHWGYVITVSNDGRFKTAVTYLEIAYKIENALYQADQTKYEPLLARTEDNLGYLLFHVSPQYNARAEKLLTSALNIRRKSLRKNRHQHLSEYAWTLNNLSELQTCIGGKKLIEAEKNYKKAIEYRIELNDHNHGKYTHYIAWSKYGLGRCLARLGRDDEAKECFNEALKIYSSLSEDIESFKSDIEFVQNVDIDIEENLSLWIGNHSHFNGYC